MNNTLKFLKTRDVQNPCRAYFDDSGIDFFVPNDLQKIQITPTKNNGLRNSAEDKDGNYFVVFPWEGLLIPTGIKLVIPTGFDMVFDNKSWIASKFGLVIGAKVIDASYRWEVHVHLINTGSLPQKVYQGQKIAQGILREVILWQPEEISQNYFTAEEDTMRGQGGFGSTN